MDDRITAAIGILLMLALTASQDQAEIQRMFTEY